MSSKSTLRKAYDATSSLPESLRARALQTLFCSAVKYAGTSNVRFLEISPEKSVVRIRNQSKVQNHIGGVHAIAMAMAAESACGILMGLNVPPDKVLVIKHMSVDYTKRCKGDITATARLTPDQIESILSQERGEVDFDIHLTDSEDKEPVDIKMVWAWVPIRR